MLKKNMLAARLHAVKWKSELLKVLCIIFTSVFVAFGLHVFVYKANFAPSGIDGLATILQYASVSLFGREINAGIFTFILNLPLLAAAWFVLNKRYVIYTLLYTVIVSLTLMLLGEYGFPQYDCILPAVYDPNNPTIYNSPLLAAIFGGLMQGMCGVLLRIGGSAGGVDVLGCMIQKSFPHKDVEKIISFLSYIVVAIAFLVYRNLNSVLLSVIAIFVCEKMTAVMLKSNRSAMKVEIITDTAQAQMIKNFVIFELRHGATVLKAQGVFSQSPKELIICLINYHQLPVLLKTVKEIPNTFLFYSDVTGIRGNFDFTSQDSREENMLPPQPMHEAEQKNEDG